MSGGGLADIYFLFQLLDIPFTIENVILYVAVTFFIMIIIVVCIASN